MKKLLLVVLISAGCGQGGLQIQKGDTGPQGLPGLPGTTIEVQAFCPQIPGATGYANRESYIIIDSKVYAVYADGVHTFLTLLNPGAYVTTDWRSCSFVVGVNGTVL